MGGGLIGGDTGGLDGGGTCGGGGTTGCVATGASMGSSISPGATSVEPHANSRDMMNKHDSRCVEEVKLRAIQVPKGRLRTMNWQESSMPSP